LHPHAPGLSRVPPWSFENSWIPRDAYLHWQAGFHHRVRCFEQAIKKQILIEQTVCALDW
jgi:hypothetical protein